MIDLIDRQLTRATNGETHGYYLSALKAVRSTVVLLLIVAGAAFTVLAAGIAAAVYITGVPIHVALGVGVLGGSLSTLLGSVTVGRYVMKTVRGLKPVTDGSEKSSPPDGPANPGDSASPS
ncbi:hypothetical protein ACFV24_32940 [Nocardia fluminea]|uniref:hypothetical protein n=1 Tax=Nocardia fluminea TaxID=134984 RepID=UPI003670209D